ncbi:MAG: Holliday junction resolvase RuvX [bacterium]
MALIGLDIGTKKTGVAIAHEPYIACEDLPIIFESRESELIGKILEIILREQAEKVIIGIPLDMKGEDTPASLKIREIGERLKRAIGEKIKTDIIYIDESMSSKRAGEYLKGKKDAKLDDSIASKIILQEYINNL